MPDRNIKLTVAYDGTDFLGWQLQKEGRTVQGVMQEGLERMHGHPVHVSAAGRTDSGVHATGQVTNFHTDLDSIAPHKFRDAVNSFLPRDVRVVASEEVGPRFHARRSALLRIYRYYVMNGPVLLPHLRNYRHWVRRQLDVQRLNEMASVLVGEHDFSSFSAEGDANESKVRHVAVSSFHVEGDTLIYTIAATSFLWKMVRTVIGTFLMLEEQGLGAPELRRIIDSCHRANAGGTAPARGLFLERVMYEEANGIPAQSLESAEPGAGLRELGVLPEAT
ncbi:MAG TPA: tRNA pseudouridine(38-40) synthase TruA [Spirochaetia bacterium]|nr:tRNA pseudouridine(38-40) synthase TruA [Spirochaetia bacterium]